MYLYPLKAIFINLEISIKLLMFDLLYPTYHNIDRVSLSFMDCPYINIYFSQFPQELLHFNLILRVSGKWRDCLSTNNQTEDANTFNTI